MRGLGILLVGSSIACGACGGAAPDAATATSAPVVVVPAAQRARAPRRPSAHGATLERLSAAKRSPREHNGIEIPLPDADEWRDVQFWLVPSVLSLQYGSADDFHAIIGGFLVRVRDPAEPGACMRTFEPWARDWLDRFDSTYQAGRTWSVWWTRPAWPGETRGRVLPMEVGDGLGRVETLVAHGTYECAYGAYPAWKDTCLVIGVAIPGRGEDERAGALRDRFARELLPGVSVSAQEPPPEESHEG